MHKAGYVCYVLVTGHGRKSTHNISNVQIGACSEQKLYHSGMAFFGSLHNSGVANLV